jgi:hypothetical protein
MFFDHVHQERRNGRSPALSPSSFKGDSVEEFPKIGWQVKPRGLVGAPAGFGWRNRFCHRAPLYLLPIALGDHLKAAIRYHFKTGHREAA